MYTHTYPEISAKPSIEKDRRSSILLERLNALHPKSIDLGLDRMRRLLEALGNPERRLPPVVHVAGTNGKGSLIAFLRAIAEEFGKRVHVYTSPHLVDFHERIVLGSSTGGKPIREDYLVDCLLRAEVANRGEPITQFEITTAAALLAFSETPADLVLLETGMGGRLDATNVVDDPLLTVITPISIDHVSFLGETLAAIAGEKAGILKKGVPCVVGPQSPEAMHVLQMRAMDLDVELCRHGRDFKVHALGDSFGFQIGWCMVELPLPQLFGPHQINNAGTAVAAARRIFGQDLTIDALERGLAKAQWPARFERLAPGLLHDYVNYDTEIWLDGGHNAAGGQAVARALKELTRQDHRKVHLVWGMMDTKDARSVIQSFNGLVEHVYTVPIPGEANSYPPEALAEVAVSEGIPATAVESVPHALHLSQSTLAGKGRVLICGSLYLAGHVLKLHAGAKHV